MNRWLIRREIWENRYLLIAPLVVTAITLFGSLISMMTLAARQIVPTKPLSMAPAPIMFASLIVAAFYSLDALYGERGDRSILFWKSLPVSDRTVVAVKSSIPLLVLPLFALALSIVTQIVLLLLSVPMLAANGISPAALWNEFAFFEGLLIMPYGLGAHTLWYAPIYGFMMLVSAWARRAPLLWAVLPWVVLSAVERIAFSTSHVGALLQYRLGGAMTEAFRGMTHDVDRLSQLSPLRFLTSAGLWAGVLFATACLAAAVRLRRRHEPI